MLRTTEHDDRGGFGLGLGFGVYTLCISGTSHGLSSQSVSLKRRLFTIVISSTIMIAASIPVALVLFIFRTEI